MKESSIKLYYLQETHSFLEFHLYHYWESLLWTSCRTCLFVWEWIIYPWSNYIFLYYLDELPILTLQSLISTKSRLVITPSGSDQLAENVICSDAMCLEVPTDDIRAGDCVLVLPGETIPVDVGDSHLNNCLKLS